MINLRSVAKKYNLEEQDLDDTYYKACRQLKKLSQSTLNEDLLIKLIQDRLEELGLDYSDIDAVSYHYIKLQEEDIANKIINSNEEPIRIIEDEIGAAGEIGSGINSPMDAGGETIQTSNNTGIDTAIGRNRPKGYKKVLVNMYGKKEEGNE